MRNQQSILVCPIKTEKNPNPFILHISNLLFYHDLQFRTIEQNTSKDILIKLSPDSYNEYHKIIQKLNIKNIKDVSTAQISTSSAQTKRPRRMTEKQQTSTNKIMSFDKFINSKPNNNIKYIKQLSEETSTPRFYQAIIGLFSTCEEYHNKDKRISNIAKEFTIRKSSPHWHQTIDNTM